LPHLLIFLPVLIVILLNLPVYKAKGSIAFWAASVYFALQSVLAFTVNVPFFSWSGFCYNFFDIQAFYDPVSRIMVLTAAIVAFSAIFTIRNFTSGKKLFIISNLMLICVAAINAISMVEDIFTMYVFIEVIAVSTYIMIATDKTKQALEGGFKYIVTSSIATVMMLFSVALFFIFAGGTSFAEIGAAYANYSGNVLMNAAVILFLCGMFIKGGIMPFHGWLTDAYASAPAGVSVFMAGIVTKTVGIYTPIRFANYVIVPDGTIKNLFLVIGAVSIIAGALAAITSRNFKKVLAYSSISQMGYIVMVLGAGTKLGLIAALFHMFNHGVFKSLLFTNSAAVESQTGTVKLKNLGGLSQVMPLTSTTSVMGFLSLSGIPPFAGFWSKLLIILALWQAGDFTFAVIAALASILTASYFVHLQRKVFFGIMPERFKNVKEAGAWLLVPSVLLALVALLAGIFFSFVLIKFLAPII
jgi:multicomponent Na+:H+ antiporter subunit D